MRITLSPEIKAHPLFAGSILDSAERFGGGVTEAQLYAEATRRERIRDSGDELPAEAGYRALVCAQRDQIEADWSF